MKEIKFVMNGWKKFLLIMSIIILVSLLLYVIFGIKPLDYELIIVLGMIDIACVLWWIYCNRLRLTIDYKKRKLILYKLKRYEINFKDIKQWKFRTKEQLDNTNHYMYIYTLDNREYEISLTLFGAKKETILKRYNEIDALLTEIKNNVETYETF
jgi:hypothetical protein